KALTLDPQNSDAHLGLANTQIALNDLTGARSELDEIMRSKATAEAYVALAQLDMKENKANAASEDVTQALGLDPTNTAALRLRQQLNVRVDALSRSKQ
ncbi:MAG TPA: tetratricopeptide repeat protein, partial [Candidatus Acidoferrum sp.]|nr:tetratricopeptide repeat protein [Candidatus Acidoferrum sp.]